MITHSVMVTYAGEEAYCITRREFASVGAPSWEARIEQSVDNPCRISVYNMGLDRGPDNKGNVRRILASLDTCPLVMVCAVWCFFHGANLIVTSMLVCLDEWTWDEVDMPCKYVGSLATISNLWRSPGVGVAFINKAVDIFGEVVGALFRRRPGRVIRTRWLSVGAIEIVMMRTSQYVGQVMCAVFDFVMVAAAKSRARPRKPKPGQDEADEYKERQTNYRLNAMRLTSTPLFHATVRISYVSKQPIDGFLQWGMSRIAKQNVRMAKLDGNLCFEPTPLSEFVVWKASAVYAEISNLLLASSVHDHDKWGLVWGHVSCSARPEAVALIVSLVLRAAAGWKHHMLDTVSAFPLMLLLVVEHAPDVADEVRVEVARLLLSSSKAQLFQSHAYSDVAWKFRELFFSEFQRVVSSNGRCPANLYLVLLHWRAQLPFETQDVEGLISTLQKLTDRAQGMGVALANARMSLKLGCPITVQECCNYNEAVGQMRGEDCNANRFEPLSCVAADVPSPLPAFQAEDVSLDGDRRLAMFAMVAASCAVVGPRFVSAISIAAPDGFEDRVLPLNLMGLYASEWTICFWWGIQYSSPCPPYTKHAHVQQTQPNCVSNDVCVITYSMGAFGIRHVLGGHNTTKHESDVFLCQ